MRIGNGEWKLGRDGVPFNQRFTANISEDAIRIQGRWEYDERKAEVVGSLPRLLGLS